MVEDESVSSEKEDNVDEECRDLAASVKEFVHSLNLETRWGH